MAKKCSNCGQKIGFFQDPCFCGQGDCNQVFCPKCSEKEIKECSDCDGLFCKMHISSSNHQCDGYEDEESEEVEDIESKSKNLIAVDTGDYDYNKDILDKIEQYEKEGYVIDYELSKLFSESSLIVFRRGGKK